MVIYVIQLGCWGLVGGGGSMSGKREFYRGPSTKSKPVVTSQNSLKSQLANKLPQALKSKPLNPKLAMKMRLVSH